MGFNLGSGDCQHMCTQHAVLKQCPSCLHSQELCERVAWVLQVMDVCMADMLHSDARLQHAACEFVLWVLQNADEDAVAAVAAPVLRGVIYALNVLTSSALTASQPLRRQLYRSAGHVAEVCSKTAFFIRDKMHAWKTPVIVVEH